MALTRQLQPAAPLWGGEERSVRVPDSLPLPPVQYPRRPDRSPPRCEPGRSPSSSESSPPELVRYRRLAARAPPARRRRRRRARSDDDDAPLVTDTPATPTNPLCEGYVNEAVSDAESRTRESNHDSSTPRLLSAAPFRADAERDNNLGCKSGACSAASSSAASSCSSGNNNPRPQHASHTSHASCTPHASHASHTSHDSHDPLDSPDSDSELEAFEDLEPALRYAPWFQAGIPREIALEVLCGQGVGAFLVRASSRGGRRLALSLRVPPAHAAPRDVAHYLILRHQQRYRIKGFTKEFPSLVSLVTHHSVMPELLPCPLRLERPPRAPRHYLPPLHTLHLHG